MIWKLSVFFAFSLVATCASADDFVELVKSCEKCHGEDGNSTTPDVAIIAGYSPEGFLNTMDVFRAGEHIAH